MAIQQIMSETFSSGPDEVSIDVGCTVEDAVTDDRGSIVFLLSGVVRRGEDATSAETFEFRVEATFQNPIAFVVQTGPLGTYGGCVAIRAIAALIEAANDAYETTKPTGKHAWRSLSERTAEVAAEVVRQRTKLRGKILSSLLLCIPVAGVLSTDS